MRQQSTRTIHVGSAEQSRQTRSKEADRAARSGATTTIAMATGLLFCLPCAINAGTSPTQTQRVTRSFTEPIQRSVVASSEAGVIREMLIKEGDRVKVGDIIAKIDYEEVAQSLRLAETRAASTAALDAARARAQLLLAQKNAIESLVPGGHVNKYELEQKMSEYETAVAEFRTAEDEQKINQIEVDRIRAQLNRRFIVSPIDGFITEIHKQPGEHVSSSEPKFATVVRIDELRVKFYLDQTTLDSLTVGDTVQVDVGRQRKTLSAHVTFVSPIINPDSGTGRLDVQINNAALKIRSGSVCYWVHGRKRIHTPGSLHEKGSQPGIASLRPIDMSREKPKSKRR